MSNIVLGEQAYAGQPGETVLDTLLRENVAIPYGCKNGVYMSCMMRSLDKAPPAAAQSGLKDTQKKTAIFFGMPIPSGTRHTHRIGGTGPLVYPRHSGRKNLA